MGPLIVAEGHDLFRLGLVSALRPVRKGHGAVLEALDFASLKARLDGARAARLALVDWDLPGMRRFQGLARLRALHPHTALLVMGASESIADIQNAFRLGVAGYVPRTASVGIVCAAVQLVLAGGLYVPAQLLAAALDGEPISVPGVPGADPAQELADPMVKLTARQRDVAEQLSLGKSNKAIARVLDISEGTVKLHLAAIFRCIGARNRTEAVLEIAQVAKRHGRDR